MKHTDLDGYSVEFDPSAGAICTTIDDTVEVAVHVSPRYALRLREELGEWVAEKAGEPVQAEGVRLTPFGVIDHYFQREPMSWSALHSERVVEKLQDEGYRVVDVRDERARVIDMVIASLNNTDDNHEDGQPTTQEYLRDLMTAVMRADGRTALLLRTMSDNVERNRAQGSKGSAWMEGQYRGRESAWEQAVEWLTNLLNGR